LLGLGLVVGVILLFILDKVKPAEGGKEPEEPALPEDAKDAKVAQRALEEMAEVLGNSSAADAAAFAKEAREHLAAGTLEEGLSQRPRWLPALARRGTEPAQKVKSVLALTSRTFFPEVARNERMMIMFHSPNCVHCRNLQPKFEGAAKKGPASVSFASVDTTRLTEIAASYNVTRLPTMLFYVHGRPLEARLPNATEEDVLRWVTFREASALTPLPKDDLPDLFAALEENQGSMRVVVVHGSDSAAEVVEDVAEAHRARMVFVRISDDDESESRVEVYGPGEKTPQTFRGPWTYDACADWFDAQSASASAQPGKAEEL